MVKTGASWMFALYFISPWGWLCVDFVGEEEELVYAVLVGQHMKSSDPDFTFAAICYKNVSQVSEQHRPVTRSHV